MDAARPSGEEMVDREGLRYVENPTGDHLLLSGGESAQAHWPAPAVPLVKSSDHEPDNIHSHEHEHHHMDHEHHHKKSVLAKVKEKAKKWRSVLTKKKHNHDAEGSSPTTTASSLEDEGNDSIEPDPEYYGAPMYESETAPKMYKERASKLQAAALCPITPESVLNHSPPVQAHAPLQSHEPDKEMIPQHQGAAPSIRPLNSTIHVSPAIASPVAVPLPHPAPGTTKKAPRLEHLRSFKEPLTEHNLIAKETEKEQRLNHLDSFEETSTGQNLLAPLLAPASADTQVTDTDSSKTLTETVTEMLSPAYNMVSDATSKIAATIQSPIAGDETGAKMMWGKGVLMTEYLLQKLEPGEEEKALSEVITEVISPKKVGDGQFEDNGVVEKVKGAVSALLGNEDQTGTEQAHLATGPHQTTSRPLFKSLEESSILTPTYNDGIPIQATEHKYEFSTPAYTDNYAEDSQGVSIRASEYTHEASMPASKGTHGASITSSAYIQEVPTTTSGYTPGASRTESESCPLASIQASEGIHGASYHTSQHSHKIPASECAHGTAILNHVHTLRDSPPLHVSTHTSSPASTKPSPNSVPTNQPTVHFSVNPATFQYAADP